MELESKVPRAQPRIANPRGRERDPVTMCYAPGKYPTVASLGRLGEVRSSPDYFSHLQQPKMAPGPDEDSRSHEVWGNTILHKIDDDLFPKTNLVCPESGELLFDQQHLRVRPTQNLAK